MSPVPDVSGQPERAEPEFAPLPDGFVMSPDRMTRRLRPPPSGNAPDYWDGEPQPDADFDDPDEGSPPERKW